MCGSRWLAVVSVLLAVGPAVASEVDSLVAAEHRFAEAAAADGMREAFLSVLSRDGVVFRPLPVNGREWFEKAPAAGLLAWTPVHAEVSRAADLGYTTGPWRYDLEGRDPAFGHYVSIWRRGADDRWQLVIDLGVSHAEPEEQAWTPAIQGGATGRSSAGLPDDERRRLESELAEVERQFLEAALEDGRVTTYPRYADRGIRFYRNGRLPVVGLDAVLEILEAAPKARPAEPVATHLAASGDLGYAYGSGRQTQQDDLQAGYGYLRIWRRNEDGAWRIVLDIVAAEP
jgi:ketosteroid isomerase-like protein